MYVLYLFIYDKYLKKKTKKSTPIANYYDCNGGSLVYAFKNAIKTAIVNVCVS